MLSIIEVELILPNTEIDYFDNLNSLFISSRVVLPITWFFYKIICMVLFMLFLES